jgi:hypothetical protein
MPTAQSAEPSGKLSSGYPRSPGWQDAEEGRNLTAAWWASRHASVRRLPATRSNSKLRAMGWTEAGGTIHLAFGAMRDGTPDGAGEQLELTLGPLYRVVVDDRISGPLTGRAARSYRSPAQTLDEARLLAALLLDRGGELDGDGPWRRPLAGGQRHVAIVLAAPGSLGAS